MGIKLFKLYTDMRGFYLKKDMDIIFFLQILFSFFLLERLFVCLFVFDQIDQIDQIDQPHAIEVSISKMQMYCKQHSFP